MKQKFTLIVFIAFASIVLSGYRNGAANNAGVDCTGSDGVTTGCGAGGCHSSAVSTSLGTTLEFDSAGVPVTSYVPGGSYTIKITATNGTGSTLPYFGCQLATVTAASGGTSSPVQAGTWSSSLPATMQFTSTSASGLTIPFVEQSDYLSPSSGSGGAGTIYTETVSWTAPAAGSGSIKVYGIIQGVNHNGSRSGDKCQQATPLTITEAVSCPSVSASATSSTTLTAVPSGATSYQWYLNGNPVSGATSSTYAPVASGSYTVQVTSTGGCVGTSAAVPFIVAGVSEASLSAALTVYPTVTRDIVNVKTNASMTTAMTYTIYGLDGRVHDSGAIAAAGSNTAIDVNKLSAGLYIMRIESQNQVATYKLIKE